LKAYHRPDYRNLDDAVYDAIQDILSNGRVSRLYRSLVRDQQIAAEAAGFSPFPGRKISKPLRALMPFRCRDIRPRRCANAIS